MKKEFCRRRLLRAMPAVSAALLAGCGVPQRKAPLCRLVLEQVPGVLAQSYTALVPMGGQAEFFLTAEAGCLLTGTDAPNGTLTALGAGQYILTLADVRYSQAVAVTVSRDTATLYYYANGGQRADGFAGTEPVAVTVANTHLRVNTDNGSLFVRQGYTLTGWNTSPRGDGVRVGLGSRTEPGATLYAQWEQWTDPACFDYLPDLGFAAVTGCRCKGQTVVIPETLGGYPVTVIRGGAFAGAECRRVVLPKALREIETDAFAGCRVETLVAFDSLRKVSGYAFRDCERLKTLYLNGATAPVYSENYFATFGDKYDRLLSLAGERKLVLFSGSSARFGYDSAMLEAGLAGYRVVNMGVFAYTNALPQMELIRLCMGPGDVLLVSPELDAAKRQFCTTNALDYATYCLAEANYDLLAGLDLREYTGVFSALNEYLTVRQELTPKRYDSTPAAFDEDGSPTDTPSYNEYGDYILYRPNAGDDTPIYGLEVPYTPDFYVSETYFTPANREYSRFTGMGAAVYLTFSPRNSLAISADSTPAARQALEDKMRACLEIPILTPLEDSLLPGRYFYGTDNHLSTEGVALRTGQVLDALRQQMKKEGLL